MLNSILTTAYHCTPSLNEVLQIGSTSIRKDVNLIAALVVSMIPTGFFFTSPKNFEQKFSNFVIPVVGGTSEGGDGDGNSGDKAGSEDRGDGDDGGDEVIPETVAMKVMTEAILMTKAMRKRLACN